MGVTAAIRVMLELRQSIAHRPGRVKASWAGKVLFRLIVGAGALADSVLSGATPLAKIRAVGLFIGNWWSLACLTIAMAGGIVVRIRVEERALMQNLDANYRSYASAHKRLVPFVW